MEKFTQKNYLREKERQKVDKMEIVARELEEISPFPQALWQNQHRNKLLCV